MSVSGQPCRCDTWTTGTTHTQDHRHHRPEPDIPQQLLAEKHQVGQHLSHPGGWVTDGSPAAFSPGCTTMTPPGGRWAHSGEAQVCPAQRPAPPPGSVVTRRTAMRTAQPALISPGFPNTGHVGDQRGVPARSESTRGQRVRVGRGTGPGAGAGQSCLRIGAKEQVPGATRPGAGGESANERTADLREQTPFFGAPVLPLTPTAHLPGIK